LIHQFVTTPGMVAVIDGALAAAISGIAISAVVGPGMLGTIPVGLVVGTATTAILMWTSVRRGRRVVANWETRFPMDDPAIGRSGLGFWGRQSAPGSREDRGGQSGA
jgi:hypothetical protein